MASNPYKYNYTVIFAAATATPTLLGEHASLTSTTYPPLLPSTAWSVGLSDSWRTNWSYPEKAQKPHLTGLSGPEAHLYIITGTPDFVEADELHSPMSDHFIRGLEKAGTRLFLTVTEKDNIVPYSTQLKYAHKLIDRGIPVKIEVLLRGGHTERFVNSEIDNAYARIDMLYSYTMALVENKPVFEYAPSFNTFAANRSTGVMDTLNLGINDTPFSLDAPYVTAVGTRFPIVFVGQPHTEYLLKVQNNNASPVIIRGIIPGSRTSTHWVETSAVLSPGKYNYLLRIKKPGCEWTSIPSTMTPSGDPAVLYVHSEEPNITPWDAWEWCKAPILEAKEVQREHTNWGLTEF
jgi:hypothetical protein